MANFDFKGYENFVVEDWLTSYLNTKLSLSRFLTLDESLMGKDGLKVTIHKYTGSGSAETLARGAANSGDIDSQFISKDYVAQRHQARTRFYDDDRFEDSVWTDSKIQYLGESMVNDYNDRAVEAMAETENVCEITAFNFDGFADAVGKYAEVHEVEDGLMFLVDIKLVPAIRKALKDTLQYVEAFARIGSLGSVCGVPVFPSKILSGKGIGYLVNSEAVKDFVKSPVRVETNRNIETKENTLIADRYDVIGLVDETKCIQVGQAQATAATITTYTKEAKTIAGAATTGATVTAYVNGEKTGSSVTASTNAYTITATENLAPGDIVKVIAELDGYAKSIAVVEVAE